MDQPQAAPPAGRRTLTLIAVLVAAAASLSAFSLWRELEQLRAAGVARDAEAAQAASSEREELKGLIERNRQALDRYDARLTDLQGTVAGIKQVTEQGRSAWLRAELKYLLRVANDELHIAQNPDTALTALKAAAARLADLPDPALNPVRERLSRDIALLERRPRLDTTGLALALLALEERVPRLPLKTRAPERYTPAAPPADTPEAASGFDALVARLERVFAELVTVRERSAPVEALLPPSQEYFLHRNLELKLETARIALLRRDAAGFASSVRAARDWIALHFDSRDPTVRDAVADLTAMEQVDVAPTLPDISGALEALRRRWPDEADGR